MADLRLNDEQQQQLSDLLGQLGQNAALRSRLESDPRGVFDEFGLGALIPEGVASEALEITIGEPEVAGYLNAHFDFHTDNHTDSHLDGHDDWHTDTPIFGGLAGRGLPSISFRRIV